MPKLYPRKDEAGRFDQEPRRRLVDSAREIGGFFEHQCGLI